MRQTFRKRTILLRMLAGLYNMGITNPASCQTTHENASVGMHILGLELVIGKQIDTGLILMSVRSMFLRRDGAVDS